MGHQRSGGAAGHLHARLVVIRLQRRPEAESELKHRTLVRVPQRVRMQRCNRREHRAPSEAYQQLCWSRVSRNVARSVRWAHAPQIQLYWPQRQLLGPCYFCLRRLRYRSYRSRLRAGGLGAAASLPQPLHRRHFQRQTFRPLTQLGRVSTSPSCTTLSNKSHS